MDDFDRVLARCIGEEASKRGSVDRAMIATCYYQTLTSEEKTEAFEISEKWIDFLAEQLSEVKIGGLNSEQATDVIFRKMAKA